MHEVEYSHLTQPYANHMWKLQALSSLSIHLNILFGHSLSGMSFSTALQLSYVLNQLPSESLGGISESGVVWDYSWNSGLWLNPGMGKSTT